MPGIEKMLQSQRNQIDGLNELTKFKQKQANMNKILTTSTEEEVKTNVKYEASLEKIANKRSYKIINR